MAEITSCLNKAYRSNDCEKHPLTDLMKIHRTIPPTAVPIYFNDLLHGLIGIFCKERYIKRLESEIKDHFGIRHLFLVSSGKAALTLILLALKKLSKKREVLIPAYTCFSVPSAIVKAGLRVSLCDIDFSTLDFDYDLLKETINENTLCVIPDHLFSLPSDMDSIKTVCKDRGIFIVEDAAQAMGVTYKERKVGTIGDVGFFSLGRGKNITCGNGGIIITNSDSIACTIEEEFPLLENPGIIENCKEILKMTLLSIFIHPSLYWFPAGLPSLRLGETIFYKDFPIKRLSGMEAGLLRYWQDRLEKSNLIRRGNSSYFCERLQLKRGNNIPCLRLPIIAKDREIRENISSLSCREGLGISRMYPTPINEIKEIKGQFNGKAFPSARRVAESLLTIPTHQFLSERDRERICGLFKK